MTLTPLTDTLQSLELDAKSTFADDPFTSARALLNQNKLEPIDDSLSSNLMSSLGDSNSSSIEDMPQLPVGAGELKTQTTGQLASLNEQIKIESLITAIPQYPGAEVFNPDDLGNVREARENLIASIVGDNSKLGRLNGEATSVETPDIASIDTSIAAEFDAFLKGTSAFPSKLLSALIKSFKALLEKLQNPDKWLKEIGEEALTDSFVEQIQGVTACLPPVAMRQGAEAIRNRADQASELARMIQGLNREKTTEVDLKKQLNKVREMELFLDDCDRTLVNATLRIDGFNAETFIELLKNIPNDAGGEIKAISEIFTPMTQFIEGLSERITGITDNLKKLIDGVVSLIGQGINKVEAITDKIVVFIKGKLSVAEDILEKVEEYIKNAIESIKEFIKSASENVNKIVDQAKQAINGVAAKAEEGIENLAETVKEQTKQVTGYVEKIKDNIDQHLNKKELERKIRDLLRVIASHLV